MIGRCHWCKRETRPVTLVGIVETNSGPGGSINACESCMTTYDIAPFADHPIDTNGNPIVRNPRGRK